MKFWLARHWAWRAACGWWFVILAASAQDSTHGFGFADFLLVPLRVHLLLAPDEPGIQTTLSGKDVTRILGKVNRVWAQAGITFYLESLWVEPAAIPAGFSDEVKTDTAVLLRLRPEASRSTHVLHVYYLKQFGPNGICISGINFVKDTASLRAVAGGLDEPLPRVTAHELGHTLSLPHRQDTTNLLASGTTGIWINEAETQQARAAAKKIWGVESAEATRQKAEELRHNQRTAEACQLWRRLTHVPLDCEPTRLARRRLAAAEKD